MYDWVLLIAVENFFTRPHRYHRRLGSTEQGTTTHSSSTTTMAEMDDIDKVNVPLAKVENDQLDMVLNPLGLHNNSGASDDGSSSSGEDDFLLPPLNVDWLKHIPLEDFPEPEGTECASSQATTHSYTVPTCTELRAQVLPVAVLDAAAGIPVAPSDDFSLPIGWESGVTKYGRTFFIDHVTKSTTWIDPRTGTVSQMPKNTQDQPVVQRPGVKERQRMQHNAAAIIRVQDSSGARAGTCSLFAHFFKEELPSTAGAKIASRHAALQRFKEKKRLRAEAPRASVRYKSRKVIANSRPRFKGRFVACHDV